LDQLNINYVIFRNVENFKYHFLEVFLVKENKTFDGIFENIALIEMKSQN
jgi:hypothetical protein